MTSGGASSASGAQRARDAVTHGAGLAGDPAAFALHVDVEPRERLRHLERLADDHLQRRAREILVDRALVDRDDALAEREPHPRDTALAAAGAVKVVLSRLHLGERLRLLCRVRVVGTGVDLEPPEL